MRSIVLLLTLGASVHATEYFTARSGNDSADGRSEKTAFATVGKGVAGLKPGDTLTILPGTYFEAVSAKISGTPEAPITIRAQRAGTVLLRGDVEAPVFQRAEGMRHTYVADFKQRIEGIAERRAMRLYEPVTTVGDVEQTNATYLQDDQSGRVYVHTSDSAPADGRSLAFSVTNGFGILLLAPPPSRTVHDVVVDGLSFTGYQSRDFPKEPGSRNRWGLAVINGERVTVRHCTSFLNSGGFFMLTPVHCLLEDCYAYGNVSRFQVVGNNILGWGVSETTFQRNVVEAFQASGSSSGDITFYGGVANKELSPDGVMQDNIAINAGIMLKGDGKGSLQKGNAAVGNGAYFYTPQDSTNLLLRNFTSEQAEQTYADPLNHDFRPQADKADDNTAIFFVSSKGDDAGSGTSLKTAWRTLAHAAKAARPGDTVYITAGEYHETLAPAQSGTAEKPIRFARRGNDRVVLDGGGSLPVGVDLQGRTHVAVNGLLIRGFARAGVDVKQGEALRVENVIITNVAGDGIVATDAKELTVSHNLVRNCKGADLRLANCAKTTVTGNVLEGSASARVQCDAASLAELWSDANAFPPAEGVAALITAANRKFERLADWQKATGLDPSSLTSAAGFRETDAERGDFALRDDSPLIGRGPGASAIGPFLRMRVSRPPTVEELALHDVGDTTATVEWWTPSQAAEATLEWGEDASCPNKVASQPGIFHTVSIIGLKPGAKYYYRVSSPKSEGELVYAPYALGAAAMAPAGDSAPKTFETAVKSATPRTLHVATTGDDHHSGLSAADALRTVNHAAELARAGDTILLHGGTYEETVVVRSSGTEAAPIVFRAAPGETVWMDGSERFRSTAFRILDKHYVQLDGLRFHHFRYAPDIAPIIQIHGGSHVTIQRCFHDGREFNGYVPAFVAAMECDHLLLENDVMINGMGEGLSALRCAELTVRHCVFYNNFIRAMTALEYKPEVHVNLSHNLFCDNIPQKTYNALLRISPLESLHSDHNAYFTRVGPEERHLVETNSIKGKTVGYQAPGQYHGENLVLADVRKLAEQEQSSRFGNPGIPVASELVPKGAVGLGWQKAEMHWDGKDYTPLDFADFMSADGNAIARSTDGEPAGLDPKAFQGGAK